MVIDLVCHMEIDPARKETLRIVYQDNTYYFCTNLCMVHFQENPEKYIREFQDGKIQKMHKGSGNKASS